MKQIIMLNDDARSPNDDLARPYELERYNDSYQDFVEQGSAFGLEITIANFNDYKEGNISCGWAFRDNWVQVGEKDVNLVYDKFPADTDYAKEVKKDLVNKKIPVFNNPKLESNVKDKLNNFKAFNTLVPYTVSLDKKRNIEKVYSVMHKDFIKGKAVCKPRKGFRSKGIYIANNGIPLQETDGYIAQPFLDTSKGIPEMGIEGIHDLRIIMVNGSPKICYARIPAPGSEFVSNAEQTHYFSVDEIPTPIMTLVYQADDGFSSFYPRLFSCDLGVASQPWILEMNGKPGQIFKKEDVEDTKHTKDLQHLILECLQSL